MSGQIVSIGEALVDMIQVADDVQPTYLAAWGGSPFNVAVGARRLGSEVEFAGSFADDALGEKLRHFLAGEGVGLDLSPVVSECNTTIAMTSFIGPEPQYAFYASPASYGFVPPAIANRQQIVSAAVVHTGSLAVLEDMTYEAITEAFAVAEGLITFDPNVRPRMVGDWDDYRQRLGRLINTSDFVKISIEDLEAAYPNQSVDSFASATLDGRAQALLVTKGGEPVTLITESESTDIPLHGTLPVVDTTGAGDATMAAMVHQLATTGMPDDHDGWIAMTRNALVVAAIVSSRRGAALSMPTRQEAVEAGAQL